jgi:dTDP-4-dehydrorhamnose reductase
MQNILITGADGQLGSVLKSLAANYPEFKFYYTDIAELNITNQAAIDDFVSGHNITCILNTAGYTNADKAESDSEQAFLINGTAVGFLAESAKKNNALLIHISTDYVFGNNHFRPIVESASPYPLSVYAEATSVLPLIISYAYHKGDWKNRKKWEWAKLFDK